MSQFEQVPIQCRFEVWAGVRAGLGHPEFCVFEFPGCDGCENASASSSILALAEDPIGSAVLNDWLRGDLYAPR